MAERIPAPKAGDKLTFLLALVPYLIDQVRVSVDDTAAHFGVAPQRIRDAVALITTSGLPGDDGAYSHADLFDIDWIAYEERDLITIIRAPVEEIPRLSSREAAALLAGLQVLAASPSFAERTDVVELMAVLGRGASGGLLSHISPSPRQNPRTALRSLPHTGDRRQSSRTCGLRLDAGGASLERRRPDPSRRSGRRLVSAEGWCLWARTPSARSVWTDRRTSELLGEAQGPRHGRRRPPDELFRPAPDDARVTLRLPTSALSLVADYRGPE